ncbi:MAG: rhomboid family intramembrane serine protease [Vicinamibacterales bacterium]
MSRYARSSPQGYTTSFGPGPITPAVKWILIANVALFVLTELFRLPLSDYFGLIPADVFQRGWVWQLGTYMFLHAGVGHILFNMLGVWMFGVELERIWGTRFFSYYYAITGLGGGVTMLLVSLLPFAATAPAYTSATIGASGALFGLLLAFALYYPERPILIMMIIPVPARIFVMIFGAIALLNSLRPGRGIADAAHLGGLVTGYLYLQSGRGGLTAEIKYRYVKWRMNRLRRKFDVYSGGRSSGSGWDRKIH